jgi:transcription elongation factor Elf1
MNNEFISIIKKVIHDRGKSVVTNLAVFNSLLADYAKGEYMRERRLFIRELKTKSFDEVMKKYQEPPPKPQPVVKPPVIQPPAPSHQVDDDDDDFDDDEDYESHQPAKKEKGKKAYFIKCPRCGEVGEITDSMDIRSRHLGYICPRCRENFTIEFFGVCRNCREKTGFNAHRLGTMIVSLGSALLDIMDNKPKGIISTIGDVIKESHPRGSSAGECTFCKQIHVECPRCRSAVKFPHNKRIDKDVVRCHNCGQRMRHP